IQVFPKNLNMNFLAPDDSSQKILELYSLFSEYYKNKDYKSALPYGWQVLQADPAKFSKFIYYKMEDALWNLHDSSDIAPEEKQAIADTMDYLYNLAEKYYPDARGYFQVRKAFIDQDWLKMPADTVIAEYELAFQYNPNLDAYYYNQLGQLYKANASDSNNYKSKAIDLYTQLSEKEPDNSQWPLELESLVENIDELVQLTKKNWEKDKENTEKAWKYASIAMKASEYQEAIEPLEFLIQKSPESVNYWAQLAQAYQKTSQLNKAEDAYKKLIQLDPKNKDNYLNLGLVYKDKGQLSAARTQFQKANDVGNGWAQAVYYEGLLYEQAARSCTFDFNAKLVYQIAVDTYRKALSVDPNYSQARDRIRALSESVPTQEDYFFRRLKSGQSITPEGDCYTWIGKSVTVP
ncbi:MAG TPA: tetratricopeptide repeat protein, partial [Ignavibacteriaceae bacterium]|nr:tetratricopeptide repeat protein [Ignavibacteriaceae bacterium]